MSERTVEMSLAPSDECRALSHPIAWREVATVAGARISGDRVECCLPCSALWDRALREFGGDKRVAAERVLRFRGQPRPWNEETNLEDEK